MRVRSWILALGVAADAAGCTAASSPPSDVFTPAHASRGDAIRAFFNVRPAVNQPIPFPHKTHIEKAKLACTEQCHESAEKGPRAGLPSVKTCMICHDSIATESPLIQKVADYHTRGVDLPWQRVYGFAAAAHVRFDHAPHLRAKVECTKCHGDVANQTVAERSIKHTMGFCVDCHREKQASNDCLTCHF